MSNKEQLQKNNSDFSGLIEKMKTLPPLTIDASLSLESENPVQNKAITAALAGKVSAGVATASVED